MISYHQLEQFGLSNKEAKVYLAALNLGAESVQNIAKKAGIHRVSTYDILEALLEKNMVSQVVKDKKRYYLAIKPSQFLERLKSKEKAFSELLPELSAIQQQGPSKIKVMYYEGQAAVFEAYFDRIRQPLTEKENLVYGSSEFIVSKNPELFEKFTQERIEKNIKAKIMVEQSPSGLREKKMSEEQLREVKFWPQGKEFKANTIIYGNRVMIVSWETMMLVIIEDKNFADNQRLIFEMLWQYLPA